jgi:hypothetical protein
MLHLSCLYNLDYELGYDATSFFSRSDDRLKLEEKIWFSEYEGKRTEMCAWQGRREVNL